MERATKFASLFYALTNDFALNRYLWIESEALQAKLVKGSLLLIYLRGMKLKHLGLQPIHIQNI